MAPKPTERLRRNFTLPMDVEDYRALEREAARLGLPMTDLVRRWIRPRLDALRGG